MPAENAGRAFALVFVDELVKSGVTHAVIAPGSRSTPLALALLENSAIEVHVRIDERSAAYLALGIASASGRAVPVVCTSGTATSYFHGAAMEADLARVPLLLLTADRPPELHGIGANQTVEQANLYGGAARWAPDVPAPAATEDSVVAWRSLAHEAVARCHGALGAPAGPVHLNLPLREPLIPIEDDEGFPFDLDTPLLAEPPSDEASAEAASQQSAELFGWLRQARRGIVVAGGGAPVAAVERFVGHTKWPLIAEPHSNARHGDEVLRSTDVLLRDAEFTGSNRPDVVVVIGRVGLSRALLSWLATVPHVVVSTDGGNWDVARKALAVVHCSADQLAATGDALEVADPIWSAIWQTASQVAGEAVDAAIEEGKSLTEPRIVRDVAALLPAGSALVVASSMPIRDLDLVMQARDDITIHANRGVSGIDGFVSTAQGVAIAHDGAGPTVALCGDLSFLHDVNGLMPGPDVRPDITYVVINNDGGGIFSLLPQRDALKPADFERLFGTPHGMSIELVAAAYRASYTRVGTAAELASDLSSSRGGVRVIEALTDRAENAKLHDRLRNIAVHVR